MTIEDFKPQTKQNPEVECNTLQKYSHTKSVIPTSNTVFLQDQNFWGSLMTPCLKIWGSLANLEGQNFFNV